MSQQYTNTDVVARRWDDLVDQATHRTLYLEPGEVTTEGVGVWTPVTVNVTHPDGSVTAEVDVFAAATVNDLPADFHDEYLAAAVADPPAAPVPPTPVPGATTDTPPVAPVAPAATEPPKE